MRTIAKGHRPGMLAGAPGDGLRLFNHYFLRLQSSPGVGAIAKGLALRPATGAPPIHAGLDFLHDWTFLKNDRFTHRFISRSNVSVLKAVCRFAKLGRLRRRVATQEIGD